MNQILSLSCGVYCPVSINSGSRITARVELHQCSVEEENGTNESKIRAILFLSTDEADTEQEIPVILPAPSHPIDVDDDGSNISNNDGSNIINDGSNDIIPTLAHPSPQVDEKVTETISNDLQ